VPLSFVYDHHWIAEDASHKNDLCQGFENYVFGIGAESRNSPTSFHAGYGYPLPVGDAWGGNIHLLHTQNLTTEYTIDPLPLLILGVVGTGRLVPVTIEWGSGLNGTGKWNRRTRNGHVELGAHHRSLTYQAKL
jgi:hypothetical protein